MAEKRRKGKEKGMVLESAREGDKSGGNPEIYLSTAGKNLLLAGGREKSQLSSTRGQKKRKVLYQGIGRGGGRESISFHRKERDGRGNINCIFPR